MPPRFACFPAPLLSLLLLAAIPTASATIYAERGFGERDGNGSIASDLNPAGLVAGIIMEEAGRRRAVTYQHGHLRELGTLGGNEGFTKAINTHGVVVGSAQTASGAWHAFAWDGKRMLDLGAMIGQGDSYATAVNAAGHVVGSVSIKGFEPMTFVYKEGVMTVRRRDDGLYLTNKITDAGLVVGAIYTGHKFQAFAVPSQAAPAPQRSAAIHWTGCSSPSSSPPAPWCCTNCSATIAWACWARARVSCKPTLRMDEKKEACASFFVCLPYA